MGALLEEYYKTRVNFQQKVEDGKRASTFSELDDFFALLRQQGFDVTIDQSIHADKESDPDAPRVFTNLKIEKEFHWISFLEVPGYEGYSETRSSRCKLAYEGKGYDGNSFDPSWYDHPSVHVATTEEIARQVANWQEEHSDYFVEADRKKAVRLWESQPLLKRLFSSKPSLS